MRISEINCRAGWDGGELNSNLCVIYPSVPTTRKGEKQRTEEENNANFRGSIMELEIANICRH